MLKVDVADPSVSRVCSALSATTHHVNKQAAVAGCRKYQNPRAQGAALRPKPVPVPMPSSQQQQRRRSGALPPPPRLAGPTTPAAAKVRVRINYGVLRATLCAVCAAHQLAGTRHAALCALQSPSELNAPTAASKRSSSHNWRFCTLCPFRRLINSRLCRSSPMPVNRALPVTLAALRTESSPGTLRSFCGSRDEAPPSAASSALHVPRSVPAASCGCSCSSYLRFH
jgi:hypothetical protein